MSRTHKHGRTEDGTRGKPEFRPKHRRFPIPPNKRHRDRKNDFVRNPKRDDYEDDE